MKILFCPQAPSSRELGGAKVVVELAQEMEKLGWSCFIKSIPEIKKHFENVPGVTDAIALKLYLQANAKLYDVIDFDHVYLPFDRGDFPKRTLMVARSVLLAHHFAEIQIPKPRNIAFQIRTILNLGLNRGQNLKGFCEVIKCADKSIRSADLVNVANECDQEILVRKGIPAKKIIILPYGIDAKRRVLFDKLSILPPVTPKVVFVGTFDYRKGCLDIPRILERISEKIPETKFSLLGTAGFCQTEQSVRKYFPKRMQKKLEVVPRYSADDLPELLRDCSVGIFPSYLEGFGFGVIEMLAAAIPVFAYNAPGPSNILGPEMLVPPGDVMGMVEKVVNILRDPKKLDHYRNCARFISQRYKWNDIAKKTSELYIKNVRLRSELSD